jgi:hypothetical protein
LTALEFLSHTHTHVLGVEQLTTKLFNIIHAVFNLKIYVLDVFSLLCMIYIFRKENTIIFNHCSALAGAICKFRPRRSVILTRYFVPGLEIVDITSIIYYYECTTSFIEYDLFVGNFGLLDIGYSRSSKLLLVLATTVIFRSESCGAQNHIFMSHDSDSLASNSRSTGCGISQLTAAHFVGGHILGS